MLASQLGKFFVYGQMVICIHTNRLTFAELLFHRYCLWDTTQLLLKVSDSCSPFNFSHFTTDDFGIWTKDKKVVGRQKFPKKKNFFPGSDTATA